MFTEKMKDELRIEYSVTNENMIKPNSEKNRGFLQLFSVNKLYTPQLIWNDETRNELLNIL